MNILSILLHLFIVIVSLLSYTQGCTDLVIEEIQMRPLSDVPEYIKLFNKNPYFGVSVNNMVLSSITTSATHTITSTAVIPPLGCFLLGASSSAILNPDYIYSSVTLNDTFDTITLTAFEGTLCTTVSYSTTDWPTLTDGKSVIIIDYAVSATGSNYKLASTLISGSTTNYGLPTTCTSNTLAVSRNAIITEFTPYSINPGNYNHQYVKLFNRALVSVNLANICVTDFVNSITSNCFTSAAVIPPQSCALVGHSANTALNGNLNLLAIYLNAYFLPTPDAIHLRISNATTEGQSLSFTATKDWPTRSSLASVVLKNYNLNVSIPSNWRPATNAWPGGLDGTLGEPLSCNYTEQASCSSLVISEIMYNPAATSELPEEYFKILNRGSTAVNLKGYSLLYNEAESFQITTDTIVKPGACVSIGSSSAPYTGFTFDIVNNFSSPLSNSGATISLTRIVNGMKETCFSVTYGTSYPWPTSTEGVSIQLIDLTLNPSLSSSWKLASTLSLILGPNTNYGNPDCLGPILASSASLASQALASSASLASQATLASQASQASLSAILASSASLASQASLSAILASSASLASHASHASLASSTLTSTSIPISTSLKSTATATTSPTSTLLNNFVDSSSSSNSAPIAIGVTVGVILTILVVCVAIYFFKKRSASKIQYELNTIELQTNVLASSHEALVDLDTENPYLNDPDIQHKKSSEENGYDYVSDYARLVLAQPSIRPHLKLGKQIGEGQFGVVVLGSFQALYMPSNCRDLLPKGHSSTTIVKCAIKQLKSDANEKSIRDFRSEAAMISNFSHPNVVRVIAVLTEEIPNMLVLEFIPYGDLRGVLKKSQKNGLLWNMGEQLYVCLQIAKGMEYLHSVRFIHRDLAARNCLVGEELSVKISDFGLSRELAVERDYYRVQTKGKLPAKWMAPESIGFRTFTAMSDVWSFGVVMWEIFEYAKSPYGEVNGGEILTLLDRGERLPCPTNLVPESVIYSWMQQCWSQEIDKRPTFTTCVKFFEKQLMNVFDVRRDIGKLLEQY